MRLIDPIVAELDQESQTTRRVLERVPEDKLAWKPHPKSMSLGQLALHLATAPAMIATIASQDRVEAPNFQQSEAKSRAEILDAFTQGLATAKDLLNRIDDGRAMATWTLARDGKVLMALPRLAMLRAILLNHSYHHRGQLTVYLRLLNVPVPSIYGPSADENPFA
jgi:uncharacterized damage-inducible protein DinB